MKRPPDMTFDEYRQRMKIHLKMLKEYLRGRPTESGHRTESDRERRRQEKNGRKVVSTHKIPIERVWEEGGPTG